MLQRLFLAVTLIFAAAFAAASPAQASVDDFHYESWRVEYAISGAEGQRAQARVTETLVPVFPDFDQNRGIVRALPLKSFGASSAPEEITVTDAGGAPVPFEVEDDDTFRMILVGDDSFVHGRQTYVISYVIADVIAPMDAARDGGTGVDEFYWDLMPVDRAQPVGAFSARVGFSEGLYGTGTGDAACYTGAHGSQQRCELVPVASDSFGYDVLPFPLAASEGVTVAIGIKPGIIAQPASRTPNFFTDTLPYGFTGLGVVAAITGSVGIAGMRRRAKTGRGVIVAQYDVPSELPPLIAQAIAGTTKDPTAAQMVHLAVSGATQIEEGKKRPTIVLRDAARAVDPLDQAMLGALFTDGAERFQIPKNNDSFATKMARLHVAGNSAALDRGYFAKERNGSSRTFGWIAVGAALIGVLLAIPGVLVARESAVIALTISGTVGALALVFAVFSIRRHRVHTPKGAETREYLLGVKEFISVAEEDRLRMLQSYSGAERVQTVDNQGRETEVIRVYEKLLPYAMLFGLEKEWNRVLRVAYEQYGTVPFWYIGLNPGTLGNFDKTLNSFSNTVSSAASYSSSSGGSTGGGFSGGGGGGGFSGGR